MAKNYIARQDTLEEVQETVNDTNSKTTEIKENISNLGGIKKVQRGSTTEAKTVTIEAVVMEKTFVISKSKGSDGYVAARGTVSMAAGNISLTSQKMAKEGGLAEGRSVSGNTNTYDFTGTLAAHTGTLSGGTTDLTVKEYSAKLTSSTTLECDGPVEWQVVEYY